MRICFVVALIALLVTGCRSVSGETEVVKAFGDLKSAGRLPGMSASEHGDIQTYDVAYRPRSKEWFSQIKDMPTICGQLYMVDVMCEGRHLNYFFCADGGTPELVGAYQYQYKDGEWKEIVTSRPPPK